MLTVMTWNVEKLFTPATAGRADFEAKLDALAAVIADAEPDAVALQEGLLQDRLTRGEW